MTIRCSWANPANPRYLAYHDEEWGVPCRDENRLFEMLNLEGAQAGLSWETVLNKRDSYRAAFDGWDPEKIARYDDAKVAELLANPGIIRNRLKVAAAITNARAYLRLREECGGLAPFLWAYVDGKPIQNACSICATARRRRRCPIVSPKTCPSGDSNSSVPPSSMPICRRSAWSMTIASTASAIDRCAAADGATS